MKKRILSIAVCIALILGSMSGWVSASDLPFSDVKQGAWYYNDVKTAFEGGLINRKSATVFDPDANLTYAEAVKLAACMHQKYMTGAITLGNGNPWYQSHVDYCKTSKIIKRDYPWTQKATRAGYMEIFSAALPDYALQAINSIADGSIPDVSMKHPQAEDGTTVAFNVVVTGGTQPYTYEWQTHVRGSFQSLSGYRGFSGETTNSLIVKAKKGDSGMEDMLRCVITDAAGKKVTTNAVKLTIVSLAPLKITKQPKNLNAKEGEVVTFAVEAEGGSLPYTYEWQANGQGEFESLENDAGFWGENTETLTVEARKATFGTNDPIRCVITDAEGTVLVTKEVMVQLTEDPLKIYKQPINTYAQDGVDGVLVVKVVGGKGSYIYEWQVYNGKDFRALTSADGVRGFDSDTLVIHLRVGELGFENIFRCMITDGDGNVVVSDEVTFHLIP